MDEDLDLSVDTPATIAILGAGPIGIEAALYARYLGYTVVVIEQGDIAARLVDRDSIRLPCSVTDCCSPLGLAALDAQNPDYVPPMAADTRTYGRWREVYLLPLSDTDLIADHIWLKTRVVAVNRTALEQESNRAEPADETRKRPQRFRVACVTGDGIEKAVDADIVVDATGVDRGGAPAPGESASAHGQDDPRPNPTIHANLQVDIDPRTMASVGLTEPLGSGRAASEQDPAVWRRWLPTTEPHFYFLGAKTYGRMPGYSAAVGLAQIRALFQIIGGRDTLDLYATAGRS